MPSQEGAPTAPASASGHGRRRQAHARAHPACSPAIPYLASHHGCPDWIVAKDRRIGSAFGIHPKLPGWARTERQLSPLQQRGDRVRRAARRAVLPDRRRRLLRRFAAPSYDAATSRCPREGTAISPPQCSTSCALAGAGLTPAGSTGFSTAHVAAYTAAGPSSAGTSMLVTCH